MADRFYGLDRGERLVTIDTSTTGKDVEVVVDDAVGLTKKDIVLALQGIGDAVLEDTGFNNND